MFLSNERSSISPVYSVREPPLLKNEIWTWVSKQIHNFMQDVITYSCRNFNGDLIKLGIFGGLNWGFAVGTANHIPLLYVAVIIHTCPTINYV